jgi:hypothetical protein
MSVGAARPSVAELDLSREFTIELRSEQSTPLLAAAEVERVLRRIGGRKPGAGPTIALSHGDGDGEAFSWRATAAGVELRGEGPRGLLYAGYDLLESIGCRWAWPGGGGELLPSGTRFELPDAPVQRSPALPGRCLIVGHRAFLTDVEEWIVWAARNRLNTLFVHTSTRRQPTGAAPEALWRNRRDRAARLARERGMTLEHGGHLLPELLPAEVLGRLPVELAAERRDLAFAELRRVVQEHASDHPEADVFHLWGADVAPGATRVGRDGHSPSEQTLLVANAAAAALEEVRPAQLAFLAYHDTEAVPERVRPRRNVCLLWAPRPRCYAHPIDHGSCPVNVPHYRDTFSAQVEHFREAGAAPARVFEYYLDAILFSGGVPVLGRVMKEDLAYYRDAGAHTVQALMTGHGPWREPHPNPWLFARLAWDPERDPAALLRDFCEAVFPNGAADAQAERYARLEEQAARRLAKHGDQ